MDFRENLFIWKNMPNDLQITIEKDKIILTSKKFDKQKLLEKLKGGKKMQIKVIFNCGDTRMFGNVKSYEEKGQILSITLDTGPTIYMPLYDIKEYKVYGDKK